MHLITKDNYEEAVDAIRDILVMYVDMADNYEGFGHASDVYIRFDRLKFVDAIDDGNAYYVDLELLRAGCAVSVVCFFYDLWCEFECVSGPQADRYRTAIDEGRLRAFPDIEHVLKEAMSRDCISLEDPWFENAVVPIYRKYVRGYFQSLGQNDRSLN